MAFQEDAFQSDSFQIRPITYKDVRAVSVVDRETSASVVDRETSASVVDRETSVREYVN